MSPITLAEWKRSSEAAEVPGHLPAPEAPGAALRLRGAGAAPGRLGGPKRGGWFWAAFGDGRDPRSPPTGRKEVAKDYGFGEFCSLWNPGSKDERMDPGNSPPEMVNSAFCIPSFINKMEIRVAKMKEGQLRTCGRIPEDAFLKLPLCQVV